MSVEDKGATVVDAETTDQTTTLKVVVPPAEDGSVVEPTESEQTEESGSDNAEAIANNGTDVNEESPKVTPALASQGGREVSHKILYVGGLNAKVTDETIQQVFGANGELAKVNILADKNSPGGSFAFVEFKTEEDAKSCFDRFQAEPPIIEGGKVVINWAYQSQQAKNDPDAVNVFVGDLSTEVDDETLRKAFERFESVQQAHVMWDMQTGHSRGYGFVSFGDEKDASLAIEHMNGKVIAGRAIRLNWAHKSNGKHSNGYHGSGRHHGQNNTINNHSNNGSSSNNNGRNHRYNNNQRPHHNNYHNGHHHVNGYYQQQHPQGLIPMVTSGHSSPHMGGGGNPLPLANVGLPGAPMIPPQSYEMVSRKSPVWQTTVYVGNLAHFTTQQELIPLLQTFGFIVDVKFYPERGCAFVKYDTHERATMAILQLGGFIVNGRPLKMGWGRSSHHHQYQNNSANGGANANGNANGSLNDQAAPPDGYNSQSYGHAVVYGQ